MKNPVQHDRTPKRDIKALFDAIPWSSRGRNTPISRLARSIVAVGNKEGGFPSVDLALNLPIQDPDHESWVMDIQGTAFQVGEGKLLTCRHVIEELRLEEREAYLYANSHIGTTEAIRPYPFAASIGFIDPRFADGGKKIVDAGMLLCPARSTPEAPYEVPIVRWGDSARLGVGDRVLIGGFPLGRDMFFTNSSNRGLLQPSFFEGIISAIIPAIREGETRLLQISSIAMGGISGGVVCDPANGRVLGMVTSGITKGEVDLPVTYAIPSEVLQPWCDSISFAGTDGRIWR
jgi:hypothetical protein